MAAFPTPVGVIAFTETPLKPAHRKKAGGYTISFASGTVIKKQFKMVLRATAAEKAAITAFFDTWQGGSFDLTSLDITDTEVYLVGFDQDDIPFDWNSRRHTWDTTIKFYEV